MIRDLIAAAAFMVAAVVFLYVFLSIYLTGGI